MQTSREDILATLLILCVVVVAIVYEYNIIVVVSYVSLEIMILVDFEQQYVCSFFFQEQTAMS